MAVGGMMVGLKCADVLMSEMMGFKINSVTSCVKAA